MTVRAAVSKAPFARRLGLPTDAARGFYPMNMMLNSSPCTRRFALGTAFALASVTLFAAEPKVEKKAEKKDEKSDKPKDQSKADAEAKDDAKPKKDAKGSKSASTNGSASAAVPRLAPAALGMPATVRIWASSAVVVDLPLVPVMPANRALDPTSRDARNSNSASATMGRPWAAARTV